MPQLRNINYYIPILWQWIQTLAQLDKVEGLWESGLHEVCGAVQTKPVSDSSEPHPLYCISQVQASIKQLHVPYNGAGLGTYRAIIIFFLKTQLLSLSIINEI